MLLKYYQKIKVFAGTHPKSLFIGGILLFLLLPIYDKALNIDGDNSPYSSGLLIEIIEKKLVNYTPEYGSYILYFLELIYMPIYLLCGIAMQEEEYRLEILPEMSIYMLAWLLVLAYHCFMLILPFTLKNFVQAAKEKQKKFLYWLYGISLPGILLSMAYILFCFSGGDWGDCDCGGTFVWLRQLPLSGYIPIIYFVTITALYQYKYSKGCLAANSL